MTNWKRLYTDASMMLAMYQDEIVPGLRKQLENRVEVVRCKDCDWYREDGSICVNPHCTKSFYGCRVREQHFCSYGERKNDV